jgi:hypothetical protein
MGLVEKILYKLLLYNFLYRLYTGFNKFYITLFPCTSRSMPSIVSFMISIKFLFKKLNIAFMRSSHCKYCGSRIERSSDAV